jgi:LPS-assembly lipoprotein
MTSRPDRRAVLSLAFGGVLSGCGFHPVYTAGGDGPAPAADLAAIDVKNIGERPGQILRQALLSRFRTEPGRPRAFDLVVSFWVTGEAQAILNFTQATRIRLVGYANWTLRGHDPKLGQMTAGSERVVDGYDIFDAQYFAVDLDNEAVQARIANAMADRITLRLAVWFHQHPTATG